MSTTTTESTDTQVLVSPADLIGKLQAVQADLNSSLFGRREAVKALLCALLSGRHILLLGPRGTGKTTLVKALTTRIAGGVKYFAKALHPFADDQSWAGPLDIPAFQAGQLRHRTDWHLPWADVAFLDEISRASDALLESLMSVLEERMFVNNGQAERIPLWLCVGAANSEFQGDRLGPVRDRFPIAVWVGYTDDADFDLLVGAYTEGFAAPAAVLTVEEVEQLRALCRQVQVPAIVRVALRALRDGFRNAGLDISDRRLLAMIDVARAHALLHGRLTAVANDLEVAAWMAWDAPDERDIVLPIVERVLAQYDASVQQTLELVADAEALMGLVRRQDVAGIAVRLEIPAGDLLAATIAARKHIRAGVAFLSEMADQATAANRATIVNATQRLQTFNVEVTAIISQLTQ